MQFLNDFFDAADLAVTVTGAQGSAFAKQIAGDFNPIHDANSKRFVVPGDLLFAIALQKYGLYQSMKFEFLDLVKANSKLSFPEQLSGAAALVTHRDGKEVLSMRASGQSIQESSSIESVLRKYVAFSGQNFPHILVPLMQEHQVMINPARPLVIYQSMSYELDSLMFSDLQIELVSTALHVNGKRGDAILEFSFVDSGIEIGRGSKKLVLSGLRPYDSETMTRLCDDYLAIAGAND